MATGYFTHRDCWLHEMGPIHPECPQRLDAIEDRLLISGVMDMLQRFDAPKASVYDLELAHSRIHIASLLGLDVLMQEELRAGGDGYSQIDPDTMLSPHTWNAALRAAGAVIDATDRVIAGDLQNAFCAVRPPGHHAERDKAMAFCFFNNVAVGAMYALHRHQLQRVAVVDFDVHHGNGTEDILHKEPKALMVSFFQHPFFPYSGETAKGENMLNIPVPAYTKGVDVREMIDMIWMPRLEAFAPEMIFISAGFDAHRDDDMGQMMLNENDYAWITQKVVEVAERHSKGRIVSSLEGGYIPEVLARCVESHIRVLAGL
ncbi:histone deacetylase family protein [Allofranklinella schreckenbergeri]|uniref:Histone deacetylase family protein n=1 Tax=Allofranklinella schreckenbergeri TaxID=1076744 RepID=A0A3M6QBI9_9BURK|nr:histone deacetylase family protein [Allofranklinella schreckenbergeri]MDO4705757.1 histone deacetylase family protein [Comamonadaceae bacterium]RMW97817.1 histone deacetylase family protein [Allofranklinella schreckenbergeri]RMX00215.1 histone deacetylase family protein [Allofranklinella schreckenbergeri]RRD42443.1 histone deacetylase family protein [Comamonadaceae bacterium OH3737_COT-264]